MLQYILLCLISVYAGLGILRLIRLEVEDHAEIFLAPMICLCFWIPVLGWAVLFKIPIIDISRVLFIITLILAVIGIRATLHIIDRYILVKFLVVLLAPMVLLAPYFVYGLNSFIGSYFWDGWLYIAVGQFMWRHNLLMHSEVAAAFSFAPLYKFAYHYFGRFIAEALLAFFSQITASPGDTQNSSGLYLSWGIFVFSCSCMFFVLVKGKQLLGRSFQIGYVAFAVLSGWMLNIVAANNYDHLLAASFLPAFCGVADSSIVDDKRMIFLFGLLSAGILYVYPEMSPLILGGGLLFLLQRIINTRKETRCHWIFLFFFLLGITAFLLMPWLKPMSLLFISQLRAGLDTGAVRPGQSYFPALLDFRFFLPCFWGFFALYQRSAGNWALFLDILSLSLMVLCVYGMYAQVRRGDWSFVGAMALAFAGTLAMLLTKYDYGAYKFISLNWWAVAFATVVGFNKLIARYEKSMVAKICIVLASCFIVSMMYIRVSDFNKSVPRKHIDYYKQVTEIEKVIINDPILVNILDPVANEWAIYFLREMKLVMMGSDHPYYFNLFPTGRLSVAQYKSANYTLTDSPDLFPPEFLVWSKGPYYLWRLPPEWIQITALRFPVGYGHEYLEPGRQGFWLGNDKVEIGLFSTTSGLAEITSKITLGPSLPGKATRELLVSDSSGRTQRILIDGAGPQTLVVPVNAGENTISLQVLDKPSVTVLPNGDSRSLLLGFIGMTVAYAEEIN